MNWIVTWSIKILRNVGIRNEPHRFKQPYARNGKMTLICENFPQFDQDNKIYYTISGLKRKSLKQKFQLSHLFNKAFYQAQKYFFNNIFMQRTVFFFSQKYLWNRCKHRCAPGTRSTKPNLIKFIRALS